MKWKMESSIAFSGLYDVYDKDGNRVAEHKILEEALLIANAPDLLKGIMRPLDYQSGTIPAKPLFIGVGNFV